MPAIGCSHVLCMYNRSMRLWHCLICCFVVRSHGFDACYILLCEPAASGAKKTININSQKKFVFRIFTSFWNCPLAFFSSLPSILPAKTCLNGRGSLALRSGKFWSRSVCKKQESLCLLDFLHPRHWRGPRGTVDKDCIILENYTRKTQR